MGRCSRLGWETAEAEVRRVNVALRSVTGRFREPQELHALMLFQLSGVEPRGKAHLKSIWRVVQHPTACGRIDFIAGATATSGGGRPVNIFGRLCRLRRRRRPTLGTSDGVVFRVAGQRSESQLAGRSAADRREGRHGQRTRM